MTTGSAPRGSATPRSSGYRERNSTADRALIILDMFSDGRLRLTAPEVAAELDCARSTAYRYLQTLVSAAYLEEAPGGGFRLGIRVLELARLARRGYTPAETALPIMREIAEKSGETVLLTRRVGTAVVCMERTEGRGQLIRLSYERGSRLPINAGASALVLLAWLPEAEVRELLDGERLEAFTPQTLVDVDAIVERLAEIRSLGYSVSGAEVDPDAMGIAAPIFDDNGTVIAALSVVAMTRRVPADRRKAIVEAVRAGAQTLTNQLGLLES